VLTIGGPRDEAFERSPGEDVFAAEPERGACNYRAYADALAGALFEAPRSSSDDLAELAQADDDFAAVRDLPGWPLERAQLGVTR
jgi:hypothetical protein